MGVCILLVGVAVAGGAYAASAGSSGAITACVHHHGGGLYVAKRCARKDRQLAWSVIGPRGLAGQTGAAGANGLTGPKGNDGASASKFFASVREDGTVLSASAGVTVSKYGGQTGAYQVVLPQDVTNCVAIANIGESTGNGLPAGEATSRTNGHAVPSLAKTVDVVTRDSAGTNANLPFNVAVFC